MTRPRPTPRVSDERLVQIMDGWPDVEWGQLAADLRDSRAEAARWKAVADELAGALGERGEHHWSCNRADFRGGRPREDGGYEFNYGGTWYESLPVDRTPKCDCEMGATLALYDAAKKESGESGMVPVADANAAIHKLQKELDRKERENR